MKFKTYLTEQRTPSPEKLMTQVYDMGVEDAEVGNPRMQNIRPSNFDRQMAVDLAAQRIDGAIIQDLYDTGYAHGKKNQYDADKVIRRIMKQ